jgi:NDP-sugar pyrophosphorylase family protein
MHALILAGGKGTRLRPLTIYTPKPVVPVMNRPFLLYQIEILARAGTRSITLSLSYQPNKIEDVLGDGSEYGVELHFVTEPNPRGTGGAYRFAADGSKETTIVLNGDVLTDIDISAMVRFHRENKAEATIALVPVEDPSAYGLVETGSDGRVIRFLEKPKPEELAKLTINTINAGIYILEPSVLELIPENVSFEYDVFPKLLANNHRFFAYIMKDRYWRDIGNPASYLEAHHDFIDKKISGFSKGTQGECDLATNAYVDDVSLIGEGCTVKPGARVTRSVLGPGVMVEEKAVIENSVIWSHTRIAAAAEIRDAVIGRSSHIGRNVVVSPGTVLGDKAILPDYSRT